MLSDYLIPLIIVAIESELGWTKNTLKEKMFSEIIFSYLAEMNLIYFHFISIPEV